MKGIAYYHPVRKSLRWLEPAEQRLVVEGYATNHRIRIVGSFEEVARQRRAGRPVLIKALARARWLGAYLLIARFSYVARDENFINDLLAADVNLFACNNEFMNKDMLLGWSRIIRDEARQKSLRIREALAARLARGGRLGNPANLSAESAHRGRQMGALVIKEQARSAYFGLLPLIQGLRASGYSFRRIAEHLNREGHRTRTGCSWNPSQVKRVLDRL